MDFVSHIMSGVAISLSLPDDPDPKINFVKKSLPIIGSFIPDMPVTFIWQNISKRLKKKGLGSIVAIKLTLDDYEAHAGQAKPWIQIYKLLHSVFTPLKTALSEIIIFGNLYATWGLLAHQIYDLPTHKFKNADLNPKPFYPFWDWTWKWGIPCPWGFKWWFFLSWAIHLAIIYAICIYKNTFAF